MHPRLGCLSSAAVTILSLLAALSMHQAAHAAPSGSVGLDCRRAATRQEVAICADPKLKDLDASSTRLFQLVRDGSKPAVRQMLLKIQRTWLVHRDAGCPTAEHSCLMATYQQHHDWLDALSNRLSEDAPLSDLKAYALKGRWVAEPVADPEGKGEALPSDLALTMIFMHLPKPGTVFFGSGARTCDAGGCFDFGWEAHPLSWFDDLFRRGWSANLAPDTLAFEALLNGKAEFTLVQVSPKRLQADIILCDTRQNCRRGYQAWRAISPDAKLVALAP